MFTSGLLIHIAPSDINIVMKEIRRCTKDYIWGFEYFAKDYTEVIYRGEKKLLWKTDFAKLYLNLFDDLELIKEKRLKYLNNDKIDAMFLLKKKRK